MQDMAVLGAVISLCLMHGITAAPLDPLFMHFCVHRCGNINMIHPALLEEWHPEWKQVISNWIAIGQSGNVTPFQDYFVSYHNLQVSGSRCWYDLQLTLSMTGCMTLRLQWTWLESVAILRIECCVLHCLLLWMKKWVKNSTFITIKTILVAVYLFQPEILLNIVSLARTKKFLLSFS